MFPSVRHVLLPAAVFVLLFPSSGQAFLLSTPPAGCTVEHVCHRRSSLMAIGPSSPQQESPDNSASSSIEAADIRQFLNQCSIQSFLFLLTQTRDPHTIKWIDTFTRPIIGSKGDSSQEQDDDNDQDLPVFVQTDKQLHSPLLNYHGLSAMNTTLFPTWDVYFKLLLEQPPHEIVVETNNPLVKEFVVDINPASLCSRILSVRSQLAREWHHDLQVIANMGSQIFYSYWNNVQQERAQQQTRRVGVNGIQQENEHVDLQHQQNTTSGWIPVPPLASQERSAGFERSNLSFLDWDPNQDSECLPSPLRKGNFDLLLLLSTQESIRRLLVQETDVSPKNAAQVAFLESFYKERRDYFTRGSSRYRRADDFLEQLMLSPPSIVLEKFSEETVLIDPLRLAELVVLEREFVCHEWAEIARIAPDEHVEIQKLQLDHIMNM